MNEHKYFYILGTIVSLSHIGLGLFLGGMIGGIILGSAIIGLALAIFSLLEAPKDTSYTSIVTSNNIKVPKDLCVNLSNDGDKLLFLFKGDDGTEYFRLAFSPELAKIYSWDEQER